LIFRSALISARAPAPRSYGKRPAGERPQQARSVERSCPPARQRGRASPRCPLGAERDMAIGRDLLARILIVAVLLVEEHRDDDVLGVVARWGSRVPSGSSRLLGRCEDGRTGVWSGGMRGSESATSLARVGDPNIKEKKGTGDYYPAPSRSRSIGQCSRGSN